MKYSPLSVTFLQVIVTANISLHIRPVPDPPVILLPLNVLFVNSSDFEFSWPHVRIWAGEGHYLTIVDPDHRYVGQEEEGEGVVVSLRLVVKHGLLSLLTDASLLVDPSCNCLASAAEGEDVTFIANNQIRLEGGELLFAGLVQDLNAALKSLTYRPLSSFVGIDRLFITAIDRINASTSAQLQIVVPKPARLSLLPNISVPNNTILHTQEGQSVFLAAARIAVTAHTPSSLLLSPSQSDAKVAACITAAHSGQLAVQRVTTANIVHVDAIQQVLLQFTGNRIPEHPLSFRLSVDFSIYGLGIRQTDAIVFEGRPLLDSKQLESDRLGDLMRFQLTQLLTGLPLANVTVEITSMPVEQPNPSLQSTYSAVQWQVTFVNADYRFPLLNATLKSSNSDPVSMSSRLVRPSSKLSGYFSLNWGGQATKALPVSASAEDVARALDQLVGDAGGMWSGRCGSFICICINTATLTLSFIVLPQFLVSLSVWMGATAGE